MRARQPDRTYDSNDCECELAEPEEPVSLPQARSFCSKCGEPIAIGAARV
jgi:hypothetical protein